MEQFDSLINQSQIISVLNKMLLYVDQRLVHHGERVAFIVSEMLRHTDRSYSVPGEQLFILSLLHDVGAYKTAEIDEMISFESRNVWDHSIYGYLFLKFMSPLEDAAESILYHHLNYEDYGRVKSRYLDCSALIYLADRIDILVANCGDDCSLEPIQQHRGSWFCPETVDLFMASNPQEIIRQLRSGEYHMPVEQVVHQLPLSMEDAFRYLRMMVYSVDFRSEYTVTHTMNTTAISLELGKRMGLSEEELAKLYLGAMIHDIGKIAISTEILEFQGRLSTEQMEIMKQHVVYTQRIIEGLVDPEICRIASRHHEKLDGSGYPEGLREADLSLPEQIAAVADIISALSSKRSYKEAYSRQRTLDILAEMQEHGLLNQKACAIMINNYDEIMRITDVSRDPIIRLYEQMHAEYISLHQTARILLLSQPQAGHPPVCTGNTTKLNLQKISNAGASQMLRHFILRQRAFSPSIAVPAALHFAAGLGAAWGRPVPPPPDAPAPRAPGWSGPPFRPQSGCHPPAPRPAHQR